MGDSVNVKVAVRCRPLSGTEKTRGARCCCQISSATVSLLPADHQPDAEDNKARNFTFDHAYFTESTQKQVYEDLGKPIVKKALEGYNGTIFAYGQTGSGKTHSMMGTGDDVGIIPKMIVDLFESLENKEKEGTKFLVTVSYLEIYNEVIKDLLNPSDKHLKIREHPDLGIYVEGLAELIVKSAPEVLQLIEQGNRVRQVAATQMNERSSRSHSCFTIKVGQKRTEVNGVVNRDIMLESKVNLVDLAGSERVSKTGATGDRLKEGAAINKSLSALGNVINMLAETKKKGNGHIPYRDSKLTRLLQESLGGNALTVMIAAISPADYNFEESLSTLQYASRAKAIKNVTKKNEDVNERIIRELKEEIDKLRQMIRGDGATRQAEDGEVVPVSKMEEMIANLERAKHQSWEEKEKLARLYEQERSKNIDNEKNIQSFMETVKEEKMTIMKKIKKLEEHKVRILRAMKAKKDAMGTAKTTLATDLERYKQMDGNPKLTTQAEALFARIQQNQEQFMKDKEESRLLKEKVDQIEEKLTELQAELVASSSFLGEQEELRKVCQFFSRRGMKSLKLSLESLKAIQDEERKKLELVKDEFLKTALEEERRKLQEETEKEKALLLEKFQNQKDNRQQEMELELFQERAKSKALNLEIEQLRELHRSKMSQLRQKFTDTVGKIKEESMHILSEVQKASEEDRQYLEQRCAQGEQLLREALVDVKYLSEENAILRKKLEQAYLWEPHS